MKKTIEMTWCLIFVDFIQLEWILGLWKANDMYQQINYVKEKKVYKGDVLTIK